MTCYKHLVWFVCYVDDNSYLLHMGGGGGGVMKRCILAGSDPEFNFFLLHLTILFCPHFQVPVRE